MEDMNKALEQAMDGIMKELEKKNKVQQTIQECLERLKALNSKTMSFKVKRTDIDDLEANHPQFAEATKTGFSKEQMKQSFISFFDEAIAPLNVYRLEHSITNVVVSVSIGHKLDFSILTGEKMYEFVKDSDAFKDLCTPDFKKRFIVSKAINRMMSAKTISFNTAVRKVIEDGERNGYDLGVNEEVRQQLKEMAEIINPLIDLYLEHEIDILAAFIKQ